ncbi:hypothetical protein UlMin_042042 [Ulmus minor]
MNRAKALLVSLGLANSFFSTQLCTTNRLLSSQVTKFSSLFLSPSNHHYTSHLVNSHQNLPVSSSNFTSNSFSELVLGLRVIRTYKKASDFFNCECEQNGFRPNSSIYVLVFPTLARKESMVSFWIVLAKMKVEGFYINKEMYLGILAQLETKYLARRFDKAEKIVKLMKTAGYKPDNITYRQLIYGLCKARRLEEACKVLVEMEGNGCVPDFKTWTVLIRGHGVAEMIERNCKVDADLINKTEDAYKLLINIVDITSLKPLQVTHTNLIEKLLMVRKLKEALNLLCLMQKQGYQPCLDPFAQNILKFGTAEDAAESLKEFPSFSAYVHALKSFFPEGRYYEAKVLLSKGPHHILQDHEICRLFSSTKCNVAAS